MNLIFHHIGIPVSKLKISNKAKYSPLFKMYTENIQNSLGLRIQYHAFKQESSLAPIIKEKKHIAFKTEKIEEILKDKQVILPLYEPFNGYRCAMILENDLLIELIETNLSEEEIWEDENVLKNGILYSD